MDPSPHSNEGKEAPQDIQILQAHIASLQNDLQTAEQVLKQWEAYAASWEGRAKELETQLGVVLSEKNALSDKVNELNRQILVLNSNPPSTRPLSPTIPNEKLQKLESQVESLQNELQKEKKKSLDQQTSLHTLENIHNSLEERLQEEELRYQLLDSNYRKLKRELLQLNQKPSSSSNSPTSPQNPSPTSPPLPDTLPLYPSQDSLPLNLSQNSTSPPQTLHIPSASRDQVPEGALDKERREKELWKKKCQTLEAQLQQYLKDSSNFLDKTILLHSIKSYLRAECEYSQKRSVTVRSKKRDALQVIVDLLGLTEEESERIFQVQTDGLGESEETPPAPLSDMFISYLQEEAQ